MPFPFSIRPPRPEEFIPTAPTADEVVDTPFAMFVPPPFEAALEKPGPRVSPVPSQMPMEVVESFFGQPHYPEPVGSGAPLGLAALAAHQSDWPPTPQPYRGPTVFPMDPVMPPANAPSAPIHALEEPGWIQQAPVPPEEGTTEFTSRESAELHHEWTQEIEQVKSDLFGAALGVSALKDRLDSLELQLQARQGESAAEPVASKEDLIAWMQDWIESNVERIIETSIGRTLNRVGGRMTARPSPDGCGFGGGGQGMFAASGHNLFSQPPQMVSSLPS